MRFAAALLATLLLAAGCRRAQHDDDATPASAAATPSVTPAASVGGTRADSLTAPAQAAITPAGVGEATRGRTVADVRAALPPGVRLGEPDERYMVDLMALPAIAGTDTIYVLLYAAGQVISDATPLDFVATTHPGARTAEGVGPGMTLDAAAAVYGPPTLAYNVNDESREYAAFAGQPPNILYRVRPASEEATFAGVYETSGEYNATTRYVPGARIFMVLVDLTR